MYKRILVPMDGSQLSECSLDEVYRVAGPETEVLLVRVIDNGSGLGASGYGGEIPEDLLKDIQKRNRAEAQEYVERISGNVRARGMKAQGILLEGKPGDEIISYADKTTADLIVISTHGRSGVSRWAFGSVADKVLRNARVPVLLVTPRGCRLS